MATTFTKSDDLSGARFLETNLRGARLVGADVSGMVMRGVEASSIEIDSPWLSEGDGVLVNGVDVMPSVEAELDRRFPGRSQRTAESPADLAAAWAAVEQAWAAAVARAEAMPEG